MNCFLFTKLGLFLIFCNQQRERTIEVQTSTIWLKTEVLEPALIDTYIYNEHEPLRDDIFKCLDSRPSVLKAREIEERIIHKMKDFVEVFVRGFGT